jgi:hypothetical protein
VLEGGVGIEARLGIVFSLQLTAAIVHFLLALIGSISSGKRDNSLEFALLPQPTIVPPLRIVLNTNNKPQIMECGRSSLSIEGKGMRRS